MRRERDGSTVFELDGVLPAVSPDGRQLAYWRTTSGVGPTDLRVVDIADPRSDRSVFAVSGQTLGGPVVWAYNYPGLLVVTERPDGSGLLLAEGTGPAAGAPSTKLIVLDLATRQTAEMMVISGPFGASHAVIPRGVILR